MLQQYTVYLYDLRKRHFIKVGKPFLPVFYEKEQDVRTNSKTM